MLALRTVRLFVCVDKTKRARTKNGRRAFGRLTNRCARKNTFHVREWLLAAAAMMLVNMQISDTGRRYCNPHVSRCFGNDKSFCGLRANSFFEQCCCCSAKGVSLTSRQLGNIISVSFAVSRKRTQTSCKNNCVANTILM